MTPRACLEMPGYVFVRWVYHDIAGAAYMPNQGIELHPDKPLSPADLDFGRLVLQGGTRSGWLGPWKSRGPADGR